MILPPRDTNNSIKVEFKSTVQPLWVFCASESAVKKRITVLLEQLLILTPSGGWTAGP
jgi:hypothetical protein